MNQCSWLPCIHNMETRSQPQIVRGLENKSYEELLLCVYHCSRERSPKKLEHVYPILTE